MRATHASMLTTVAALSLLGLPACNPSSFNSVFDKAPVASFSPAGSSTSSMFVLPLPVPAEAGTTSAARMLVTRTDSDYLAVADYDMNGKVTLSVASGVERSNVGAAVNSAAVLADAILLGTPRYGGGPIPGGRVSLLSLVPQSGGGYSFITQAGIQGGTNLPRVGVSVAAGFVTGATTGDFVAVSDGSVQVLGPDGKTVLASTDSPTGLTCATVQLSDPNNLYAFRPVAVGNVLAGGQDEIVLGGKLIGENLGRVIFVQYDGTKVLPCPSKFLLQGASQYFGTSLAIADFDGDGNKDLAVGTPPDRVYVYFGPLDGVTDPAVTILGAPSTAFGQKIASYTPPGQASAQLLVADPSASVGDRVGAGMVLLFNVTKPATTPTTLTRADAIVSLFDSNKDSDPGVFGANLGGLVFNTGLCVPGGLMQMVPWASSNSDVLTFFQYPRVPPPADPRCFAMK
jgi:hypothetical protein